MKTVTGRVTSAQPISLSKASRILSGFVYSDNAASQAVNAYLRRSSDAFTKLNSFHTKLKPSSSKETKSIPDAKVDRSLKGEFDEVGRAKENVDLVVKGAKTHSRKSETVTEEKPDEIKEVKKKKKKKEEDIVEEKVEEERKKEEKKKKKRKNDVEMESEEKKSKKKRKSKEIDD